MIYAVRDDDGFKLYRGTGSDLSFLGSVEDDGDGMLRGSFDTHDVSWQGEAGMGEFFARRERTNDEDRMQVCDTYAEAWATEAWQGEGWYSTGWSDGGERPEPEWFEEYEDVLGCVRYLLGQQSEYHLGWIEYAGNGDEPEER